MCRNSIIHIVDEDGREKKWWPGVDLVGTEPQMVLVDGVVAASDDGIGWSVLQYRNWFGLSGGCAWMETCCWDIFFRVAVNFNAICKTVVSNIIMSKIVVTIKLMRIIHFFYTLRLFFHL